jgi:DNA sulfur modification protein DndD
MILLRMKLTNFRQFRGTQEIEFAAGSNGNVTVVFGENGRGKTGIYRALLFCLYGEKRLSQDAQVDDRELYLVNYPEMEATIEEKKPVEAGVYLEFKHLGKLFQIERKILGLINDGEVLQEDKSVRLVTMNEDGNAITIRDPNEIQNVVEGILDRGLREYFLFDGEKIERLTRASADQRKEISLGVRKLLDIDVLETAMRATKRLKKYLDAEIETRATGEHARVIKQLRENDERTNELNDRTILIDEELSRAAKEKNQVDAELEKIRDIRDLLTERNNLENQESDLESQIEGLLIDMKNRTGKTALLLVKKTTEKIFRNIDKRKQKHEIPSEIRRDLIDRLITDGRCICGTRLKPGTNEHRQILLWRDRTRDILTEDSMLNLWRFLSGLRSHYEDIGVATESLLQKFAIVKNELLIARRKLEGLRQKIGSSERADASKLERHRQQIERKIIKLEGESSSVREELIILKDENDRLQQQRKEIEKEQGIRDELSKRSNLAADTSDVLKIIHEEFTGETRDLISANATKYFLELLDYEGKQTLRNVVVDTDYSIQVFDRWEKPFLANISAGQRQIMSIAFIAALARAAAGKDFLEMPLFMDTPFGRLSHDHRRNLLTHVPTWCTQWVLLATDTEFGRFEAQILRGTNQWGKFYTLKGVGAGTTKIEVLDVNQVNGLLRDEAEAE